MMILFFRKHIFFLLAFTLLAIVSCGSDDESTSNNSPIEEGRRMQMTRLYDLQIIPLQENHLQKLTTLGSVTTSFNNSGTSETLSEVKIQWKNAFSGWKSLEIYSIAPMQNLFIQSNIHQWPVNSNLIENNIAGTIPIDADYIASLGANAKGYGAIEYLLFHENEAVLIEEFTTQQNAERRKAYLAALVQQLYKRAEDLRDDWSDAEDDFKNNLTTDVNGSQNKVVNALIASLEKIKNSKIEEALSSSPANPEALEAFYSEESKAAITENLLAIRDTYTGTFNASEGFGLSNYVVVTLENPTLDAMVISAFEEAFTTLSQFDGSLENAITENPELVETLRINIQSLVQLFKTDIASAANIIVTFNDNDGD